MKPGTYGARGDESGAPDPADWPPGKPGRPYGVYPEPPGLGREPWMTDDDVANLPGRPPGQSCADWLAARAAYVEGLQRKRAAAAATGPAQPQPATAEAAPPPAPPPAAAGPAAPTPAKPTEPPASAASAATAGPGQPRPLLRRQERFREMFVVLGNASEAAWQAGYKFAASRNQGYRLLRLPAIQARIAELQRDLARAIRFDADVMLGKLEGIYRQAVQGGYYNAAARIVEIQARVAGHLRLQSAAPAPPEDER